ncbi:hypothetical protein [Denitrobaculum tricleocarpae]|uniref:Tripartite tricarboxylate transporter TctB family protein n=1 Tax=Denitrobaculum tricleocarpae TaxID=2591009 RepID=A0A545TX20_9PROT|nr:hypothetical protein [Denitrobaculum tricleocarpae]TQV81768.1 hypothetical protein FKG95_05865 [Denitrobaculum tricleocarpae]
MRLGGKEKREALNPWDIGFGAALLVFALWALFFWFPADIPTGFFFINSVGREEPGDAFFPIILASLLAGLSLIQMILSWRNRRSGDEAGVTGGITLSNLKFLALFLTVVGVGLGLMYWLGPVTVAVLNAAGLLDGTYRNFSDTVPYKYLGYVAGGSVMTLALIVWAEGRVRPVAVMIVIAVLVVAILLFDVALRNVLLPPNADF